MSRFLLNQSGNTDDVKCSLRYALNSEMEKYMAAMAQAVVQAVHDCLGPFPPVKAAGQPEWISQNQASKMVGRKRLETAKQKGIVAWQKKDFDNPRSRVYVRRSDVLKLLKKPF